MFFGDLRCFFMSCAALYGTGNFSARPRATRGSFYGHGHVPFRGPYEGRIRSRERPPLVSANGSGVLGLGTLGIERNREDEK